MSTSMKSQKSIPDSKTENSIDKTKKSIIPKDFQSQIFQKNNKLNEFTFKFSNGEELNIPYLEAINNCPIIPRYLNENHLSLDNLVIDIPLWITIDNLKEYLLYLNDESYNNFNMTVRKLLFIADYFDNNKAIVKIIQSEILNNLNKENTIYFLADSYTKINLNPENSIWFQLFCESLNNLIDNFNYFLENEYDKLKEINKLVIEEVIEKFFQKLQKGEIDSLTDSNYTLIINLLHHIRGTTNIYELIYNENSMLNSEEALKDILNLKPNFKVLIKSDTNFFYKEFNDIQIDDQKIGLCLFYKNKSDSFNLLIKSNYSSYGKNKLDVLSYTTFVFLENQEFKQFNIFQVNPGKNQKNIFKIKKFDKVLSELEKTSFRSVNKYSLSMYVKISYTHSAIFNYYLKYFYENYENTEIMKMPYDNLTVIIENRHLNLFKINQIVISLMIWLGDEKNQNNDIGYLIEKIDWIIVPLELLIEFIFKFHKLIEHHQLKQFFSLIMDHKLLNKEREKLASPSTNNDSLLSFNPVKYENLKNQKFNQENLTDTLFSFASKYVIPSEKQTEERLKTDIIEKNLKDEKDKTIIDNISNLGIDDVEDDGSFQKFNNFYSKNKIEEESEFNEFSLCSNNIDLYLNENYENDCPYQNLKINIQVLDSIKIKDVEVDSNGFNSSRSDLKINNISGRKSFNKVSHRDDVVLQKFEIKRNTGQVNENLSKNKGKSIKNNKITVKKNVLASQAPFKINNSTISKGKIEEINNVKVKQNKSLKNKEKDISLINSQETLNSGSSLHNSETSLKLNSLEKNSSNSKSKNSKVSTNRNSLNNKV